MARLPAKRPQHCQKELFWLLRDAGMPMNAVQAALGISHSTSTNWVKIAGGIAPAKPERTRRCLTPDHRTTIAIRLAQGWNNEQIATDIGFHPATVGREIERNGELKSDEHVSLSYHPGRAQTRAEQAAKRPKLSKLHPDVNRELHDYVQSDLAEDWSPEQISKRLIVEFPDRPEMRVSHETIYQGLYVESRGALKKELVRHLRTGRAVRKPQRVAAARTSRIPDECKIGNRPADIETRLVPGHWEGDLICGSQNKSAIGTLVERTTGFTLLLHLPNGHHAEAVRDAMIEAIRTLPEALRLSVTWDQGVELARHAEITLATDIDFWFCDPHSPWQRGSNENTNGLLRQYFPKGTDLSVHSPERLAEVAHRLNGRPRKRLDWLNPREALNNLLIASTA